MLTEIYTAVVIITVLYMLMTNKKTEPAIELTKLTRTVGTNTNDQRSFQAMLGSQPPSTPSSPMSISSLDSFDFSPLKVQEGYYMGLE